MEAGKTEYIKFDVIKERVIANMVVSQGHGYITDEQRERAQFVADEIRKGIKARSTCPAGYIADGLTE